MSPVQQKYEIIVEEAGKFLASEEFRRAGRCFHKLLPPEAVRWSICFQKSRYSTAEKIKFTLEVAAEWKRRPASCEDWEPQSTWYTGIGSRIGYLMPKKEDTWWDIDEGTPAEFLSHQINAVLSSCVLPFFREFLTEQSIVDHLKACERDTMRRNYPHAITMLEFDLLEKKERVEIERRIRRIRFLGRIQLVNRGVTEATIQRVLTAYGYSGSLPAIAPWWKLWA
jgi:Domain of unknown function (DUF4304)